MTKGELKSAAKEQEADGSAQNGPAPEQSTKTPSSNDRKASGHRTREGNDQMER